jgi:hypothetical protein
MEGEIRVSLEREPDFFAAAAVEGSRHDAVVARDLRDGRIVGMGSRSARRCYLNGRPAWLPYLGALRVERAWRGRPRAMAEAYDLCRQLRRQDEVPFCLTSVVADNIRARRLLEAGLRGMPVYRPVGETVTLAIPVRGRARRASGTTVERADASGLDEIVGLLARFGRRHQFHPVWEREDLLSGERTPGLAPRDFLLALEGGRAVGCLALWDQRSFKQAVVRGYSPRLARLRPLVNLLAPLLSLPRIPPVGGALQSAFLSHLAAEEGREDVLPALIRAARIEARRRGLECLLLGLAAPSQLLPAVAGSFGHREYRGVLYLVHWKDGAAAAAEVDGRVPHVEVAAI